MKATLVGLPLAKAAAIQPEFDFTDVDRTLVGVWALQLPGFRIIQLCHRRAQDVHGELHHRIVVMAIPEVELTIDEYLRKRLMPVEGAIPQLAGIDMYGNSIPAGTVGGDLFEYINFQQRYNIHRRIARALKLAKLYLDPLPAGQPARNMVDDHVCWLETRLNDEASTPLEYRKAKSSEQLRIAEDLPELKTTAGVLLVDAQGHGL